MNLRTIAKAEYLPWKKQKKPKSAWDLIEAKEKEYTLKADLYYKSYYLTRIVGGLSAGLLPFVIAKYNNIAIGLSITIVVVTVFDTIFNPRSKSILFSKGSDYLTLERLKATGEYVQYKEMFEIIKRTESKELGFLLDLKEVVNKAQEVSKEHSVKPNEPADGKD